MWKPSNLWEQAQSHGKTFLTKWSILAVCQGSPWGFALGILPSSLATSSFKKNGAKGEWRGSQMLSLSRQPFLSTHYWDFGEGAHPRDLLLPSLNWKWKRCNLLMPINPVGIFQQYRGISYGDLLWGQLGHLLFPPSFWEAAAYHFGGNSRAKLSMSNASCMPLGDPGKAHSSLGKCSLNLPFSLCLHCILKRASADKFNSWRPYLITSWWPLIMKNLHFYPANFTS